MWNGASVDFLVRKEVVPFRVDSQNLITHSALMKEKPFITKFVGYKLPAQELGFWLQTLNHELGGEFFCIR